MSSLITRISSNLQLKDDYISSIIRRSNYYYRNLPQPNHFQTPVITLFSEQLEVDKCREM